MHTQHCRVIAISNISTPSLTIASFIQAIEALAPFEERPHIAIALSGGSDSLALTYLAQRWLEKRGGRLTALIVDHGLRPKSAKEAEQVSSWAKAWEVRTEILKLSSKDFSRPHRLQEEARKNRYDALIQACKNHKIQHLLLGHHLEDQAETQVMRFLKGSGISGLKGIKPVVNHSGIRLLRPLLPFSKDQIRSVLPENQPWIEDPSNQSDRHIRNRLRQFLKNDSFVNMGQIARSASKFEKIEEFLDQHVNAFLQGRAHIFPEGYALLDFPFPKDLDPVILERALSQIIQTCSGRPYPPRSQGLLRIVEDLKEGGNFLGATCGGCLIKPYQRKILIAREWALSETISLTGQKSLIWDGRFFVENLPSSAVGATLEALGERGIQELGRKKIEINVLECPPYAKLCLPCVRFENNLVSIPHLKFVFQGKIAFQPRVFATSENILKR